MSSSVSGSDSVTAASAQSYVRMHQLTDLFLKLDGALAELRKHVHSLDTRLGLLEEQGSEAEARPSKRARTAELETARQALAEMTSAQVAADKLAAERLTEIERLQAAVTAAEEAAAQFQAEGDSLRATLSAISDACQCPIKHDFTADMVVASDGEGYDREALQQWKQRSNTSPVTREELRPRVYPNRFARRVFEELQRAGMDRVGPGAEDVQSLLAAIKGQQEAKALELLQLPRLPCLNEVDQKGATALYVAIGHGWQQVALAIVGRKDFTRINFRNRLGWSALHVAACEGMLPLCEAILDHRDFKELHGSDNSGQTAFQMASQRGHREVAECLRRRMREG